MERRPERIFTVDRRPFTADSPVLGSAVKGDPTAPLVVFCHGMSETPERALRSWPGTAGLPVHVIAPAGPYPHEVRREGSIRIGHAWYLYDGGPELFKESLDRSASWLVDAVDAFERNHRLRPRERALVGYSQGAYFGYVTALTRQDRFHRLAVVAGRLKEAFLADALATPGQLETLILHGERDRAVSPDAARRSAAALERAGYRVRLELLPGGHALAPDRDEAVSRWLAGAWGLSDS